MVTIFIDRNLRSACIRGASGLHWISVEMAECLMRQYPIAGWRPDPDNSDTLAIFHKY